MEESAASESKVASTVQVNAKSRREGGDDSSTPISKFVLIGDVKGIQEGGDGSTSISKFLLITIPSYLPGDFLNMPRHTTSVPRLPAACLVFMEKFLEDYVKVKRTKERNIVSALSACGKKWTRMSDSEKEPYRLEASRRLAVYEKHRAAVDRFVYGLETPPDGEFDDGPSYEIVSPFGIFLESEIFLTGARLTSFTSSFGKWNSMSPEDKAPFLTLSVNRMRTLEFMAIEFFAHLLDKCRKENDGLSSSGDSEGNEEGVGATTGLLVFLEEFMEECDDEEKILDPEKSGRFLIEEKIQEWYGMTEEEQRPYHAKAEELMTIYDRGLFRACVQKQRSFN